MTVECKDGLDLHVNLNSSGEALLFTKETDYIDEPVCKVEARGGKVIFSRAGECKRYIANKINDYSLLHYKHLHSVEITTEEGHLYCVVSENRFHVGLFENYQYSEMLVIGEDGFTCDLEPAE